MLGVFASSTVVRFADSCGAGNGTAGCFCVRLPIAAWTETRGARSFVLAGLRGVSVAAEAAPTQALLVRVSLLVRVFYLGGCSLMEGRRLGAPGAAWVRRRVFAAFRCPVFAQARRDPASGGTP